MADDKKGHGRVPMRLGRRYKDVGPDLGRLYESWQVGTGLPSLLLMGGDRMDWQPEGAWRFEVCCQGHPLSVELSMQQLPPRGEVPELMNILALLHAAVGRVEHDPRVRAHFARGPLLPPDTWTPRIPPGALPRRLLAVTGWVLLAAVLGVWLRDTSRAQNPFAGSDTLDIDAPGLGAGESPANIPPYPLPSKPFRNQALAPCATRGESAINGGCWMELARRPPCYENQAEYQGKCYMPVVKPPSRLPQSTDP